MNIRLKDSIHPELKSLGLKPGDLIDGQLVNEETGLVHYTNYYKNYPITCSIWKEDYEIIDNKTPNFKTVEAAYFVGFEPSEEASQNNELLFFEAQEYLTNEALRV